MNYISLVFSKRTLICACFFLGAQQSSAQTLMDVYNQALKNDYTYRAAQAEFQADKQLKNITRANLLPNIRASGFWSDSETDSDTRDVTRTSEGSVVSNVSGSNDNTRSGYSISLDQTLFNLSSWLEYESGKIDVKIAELSLAEQEQELILRVARSYFDALEAVEDLQTATAEEKAFGLQLDQTRQRFEVGLTAVTDVHEAQAVFDSSTATRIASEGAVEIAFEALEVISGQPYNSIKPLKANFPVAVPQPNDRNEWVAFAEENNLSLLASSLRVKSFKKRYRAARASHLPTLSTTLSYGDTTSRSAGVNEATLLPFERDNDSAEQSISVNLNIPIFAGGQIHAQRKRAGALALQQKELYNQVRRGVVQEARSSFINVVTGVSAVKARSQAITSNESALEATQAGYDVGTRDLIDVLQAQQSLFSARRNFSSALYQYLNNTLSLKQAAGTLSVEDLELLNDALDLQRNVTKTF